ncbi:MAG: PPOX class F420-dependent oxidoreductase [Actinomycetota bacterium]
MRRMSAAEAREFLSAGTRTGKVAVVRADGSPLVVPIWFVVDDDGCLVFTTGRDTVKGRALARDGRVSVCVDDETPPFGYVRVDGVASLSDDLDEMLPWATRIAARYMGAERADAYGRRNAVPGEVLVRVRPSRVVAEAGVAD